MHRQSTQTFALMESGRVMHGNTCTQGHGPGGRETCVREECAKAPHRDAHHRERREREGRWQRAAPAGMWAWRTPCPFRPVPGSPFSLCWKEGENSLAVILAIRASSWAFCAAVRAASALAREWEVLGERDRKGREGTGGREGRAARPHCGLGQDRTLGALGQVPSDF